MFAIFAIFAIFAVAVGFVAFGYGLSYMIHSPRSPKGPGLTFNYVTTVCDLVRKTQHGDIEWSSVLEYRGSRAWITCNSDVSASVYYDGTDKSYKLYLSDYKTNCTWKGYFPAVKDLVSSIIRKEGKE